MSLKILAVDEEPETLKYLRSLVVPMGHEIHTFEDSQEAAKLAEKRRFDIVFASQNMPGIDGIQLARLVGKTEMNGETPFVLLTQAEDIPTMRKAYGEGITFCMPKPINPARLVPMLIAWEGLGWKYKLHAARLPLFAPVNCKWRDQQFSLRSANISETGMLLEPSLDAEIGEEVRLDFKIVEVDATLSVRARIARKEEPRRMAVEFIGLESEARNPIQLYIMGRIREKMPPRRILRQKPLRLFAEES